MLGEMSHLTRLAHHHITNSLLVSPKHLLAIFAEWNTDKSKTGMRSEGASVSTGRSTHLAQHTTKPNQNTRLHLPVQPSPAIHFFHSFLKPQLALTMSMNIEQDPPGLSSENLLTFRVALTCPGSSSGLQTSLPTRHIPLRPCIRMYCGQVCVHPLTFLISSWMSHLLVLCSGRVLQGMGGHPVELVLYQTSWSNFEPESLFFPNCTSPPVPGGQVPWSQGGDISPVLSSLHREHPLWSFCIYLVLTSAVLAKATAPKKHRNHLLPGDCAIWGHPRGTSAPQWSFSLVPSWRFLW